jgi:serine/threonine-protein kinase
VELRADFSPRFIATLAPGTILQLISGVLRIHALGRMYARGTGGLLTGNAAEPRRLAILALLASMGDRGIPVDTVTAWLWPGAEPPQPRVFLHRAIWLLERDLGVQAILRDSTLLRLNTEVISSDVAEFESALAQRELDLAESRYGGQFLDGFYLTDAPEFELWVEGERTRLAGHYLELLEQLARRATDREDHHGAVQWWRKLATRDPLNARVTLDLMRALERVGDRTNALRQAKLYEVLVEQNLDAPLDRQVISLAAELKLAG